MVTLHKHFTSENYRKLLTAIIIAILAVAPFLSTKIVGATALNQTMVRFDRIQTSTPTTGTVCFKPTTATASSSVQVTFPTGYTVSGTAGNWTVSSTNLAWPSGGSTITGITTASGVSSQTVTFPFTSATLSTSTLYCFNWTNSAAVSTNSSATPSNTGTVTLSNGDTAQYGAPTVTSDQIAVSATVGAVFSFALSGTTDSLGALTTGSIATSPTPRTATVSTNATNGWMIWTKDAYQGLCSPSVGTCTAGSNTAQITSKTPGSNSTLVAGSIGNNLGVLATSTANGSSPTIASPFVGTSSGQGGGLTPALQMVASATGPSDTSVLTLKNNVTIDSTIKAASDYADTITVVGAGLF